MIAHLHPASSYVPQTRDELDQALPEPSRALHDQWHKLCMNGGCPCLIVSAFASFRVRGSLEYAEMILEVRWRQWIDYGIVPQNALALDDPITISSLLGAIDCKFILNACTTTNRVQHLTREVAQRVVTKVDVLHEIRVVADQIVSGIQAQGIAIATCRAITVGQRIEAQAKANRSKVTEPD